MAIATHTIRHQYTADVLNGEWMMLPEDIWLCLETEAVLVVTGGTPGVF